MDYLLNIDDMTNTSDILDILEPARTAIETLRSNVNTLLIADGS